MFARAEQLNMTAHKLLTGKDGPLLNIEMALMETYHIAKQRFQQQQKRHG